MLKKVASNTIAQLVAKFVGAGLTLLTTYYTIRLTNLDLYGDLTRILVMVAVGFTIIDFGLNAEGVRSSKSDLSMQKSTQTILLTRLLLSLLVLLILNLIVYLLPGGYTQPVKSIFWLGSLAIIFQGLYTSINSWFQYTLSYWKSTISVIVGSTAGSALTFYFLYTSPTLSNLILANTLGYFTMALTSLFLFPKLARLDGLLQFSSVLPLLRRSLTLGLILVASVLASKFDTVVLGVFRQSSEVGEYGFAYRIFDVVLVIPVFVMNAVYPLFIKETLSGIKSKLIFQSVWAMGLVGVLSGIILWHAAPLVLYVKPELTLSIQVLKILSFALPLFFLTAPLMWGLIGLKKDGSVLLMYLLAALINIALSLLFIPSYGALAAAINTGLTELFILFSLLYLTKKVSFP